MTEEKKQAKKPDEAETVREIVKVIESKEIAAADAFGRMTRGQLELIKRTVAAGASDDELRLFIQVCKGANLNPFLRQAHLVPFWDSKSGSEKRTIVIGIDGFRAIAESSGAYAGNDDAVFEGETEVEVDKWEGTGAGRKVVGKERKATPVKATVTVYKIVDGQRYAFSASARWAEYFPGPKKGARWLLMPFLMLGKCAEGLALRKAFPKLLSGLYVQEEMDQAMNAGAEEAKAVKGFGTLMKIVKGASAEELKNFGEKMAKSDKYTDGQKAEFAEAADARLKELAKV